MNGSGVLIDIFFAVVGWIWKQARPRTVIWLTALGITALILIVSWSAATICQNGAIPECRGYADALNIIFLFLLLFGGPVFFFILSIILAYFDRNLKERVNHDREFRIVRYLIKDGHYAEAEKMLGELDDDPKARKWQKKIHRILEQEPGFNSFET